MGKGAKRRKKAGHRVQPRRSKEKSKISFLCDQNIPRSICDGIGSLSGFSTQKAVVLGIDRAADAGGFKAKAIELKSVILTNDTDFLNVVDFQICTHPGVLVLRTGLGPVETLQRIKTFLLSKYYKKCKHGQVQLYSKYALVKTSAMGELDQVAYLDE